MSNTQRLFPFAESPPPPEQQFPKEDQDGERALRILVQSHARAEHLFRAVGLDQWKQWEESHRKRFQKAK